MGYVSYPIKNHLCILAIESPLLHFILLQYLNSVFLSRQFSTPNLNVIDDMTNLEQEHTVVVNGGAGNLGLVLGFQQFRRTFYVL